MEQLLCRGACHRDILYIWQIREMALLGLKPNTHSLYLTDSQQARQSWDVLVIVCQGSITQRSGTILRVGLLEINRVQGKQSSLPCSGTPLIAWPTFKQRRPAEARPQRGCLEESWTGGVGKWEGDECIMSRIDKINFLPRLMIMGQSKEGSRQRWKLPWQVKSHGEKSIILV